MVQITKTEARKIFNNGGGVYMCASKLREEFAFRFNKSGEYGEDNSDFDHWVNSYRYYNCNKECGEGVKFFKEI